MPNMVQAKLQETAEHEALNLRHVTRMKRKKELVDVLTPLS
jgi:hypothetical protein